MAIIIFLLEISIICFFGLYPPLVQTFHALLLYPLLMCFLRLVPITMELVALIKEPKALLNSRHELQARASKGAARNVPARELQETCQQGHGINH